MKRWSPEGPVPLHADAQRLVQVACNLITNAAKYTPPGGLVRVVMEREPGHAVLRVSDNGIGIPPALLDRIFDLYEQAPEAQNQTQGGLGIGLALVRQLVELHGGSCSAASEGPGQGSTFTVRLPAIE